MEHVNKVLAATAFSGYGEGLVKYAAKLAASMDAELLVVSVINERDIDAVSRVVSMGYDVDGEHYVEGVRKERKEELRKVLAATDFPKEKTKTFIPTGHPVDEILNVALEEEVDMIVMGTKGRTDLSHVFVGSVADKVFRKSPVTVVSYRDDEQADRLTRRIHRHRVESEQDV